MAVKRLDYRSLSASDRKQFVDALLAFKKNGNPSTGRNYDTFVNWHLQMMQLPPEQMRAHMSPMFLPWHREFLRLLELDLQAVSGNPALAIPYWNWADPNAGANETLWADDFMGGNGRSSDLKVMSGPFAGDKGNWPLLHDDTGMNYLSRAFGSSAEAPNLPSADDVQQALAIPNYDVSPWTMDADISQSFRNNLEGWGADLPRMHNQVHVWVGGDKATMALGASPNDPVFFLNHANIDRIWSHWQDADASHVYLPTVNDPQHPGLDLNAIMPIFLPEVRPIDVLDIRSLGYEYDTSVAQSASKAVPPAPPAAPATIFMPFRGVRKTS